MIEVPSRFGICNFLYNQLYINQKGVPETADYSAITTWGVFQPTEDSGQCLILLDAVKGRYEFPELRRVALEQYGYWNPETIIVESKASGLPLTYELRKMGIPILNFTPSKGNDKHTRVNSVFTII
jgi:phage terminase large subunit-like protein